APNAVLFRLRKRIANSRRFGGVAADDPKPIGQDWDEQYPNYDAAQHIHAGISYRERFSQSINFNRNFASEDTILPFDGKIAGPRAPPHKGIKSLTTQELFETQTVTCVHIGGLFWSTGCSAVR